MLQLTILDILADFSKYIHKANFRHLDPWAKNIS